MAADDRSPESRPHPELSSLSTTLDEVMQRLSSIAEAAAGDEQPFATELFEIERDLQAGARRLAKLVGDTNPAR